MNRGWTPAELEAASEAMKASGNLGYEEFCEETEKAPLRLFVKMLTDIL